MFRNSSQFHRTHEGGDAFNNNTGDEFTEDFYELFSESIKLERVLVIFPLNNQRIYVIFRYNKTINQAIRKEFDPKEAAFDRVVGCWMFNSSVKIKLMSFLNSAFLNLKIIHERIPEDFRVIIQGNSDWALLKLAPNAPIELVEMAYKIAAKKAHPDTGGTHEQMKSVNEAYSRLKERLKKNDR